MLKRKTPPSISRNNAIARRYDGRNATATFSGEVDPLQVTVTYNKNVTTTRRMIDPDIRNMEDGQYTYIIDFYNGKYRLICSPAELFEAGSKHLQIAKNSTAIVAGGEFELKNGTIYYNMMSGTFMELNKSAYGDRTRGTRQKFINSTEQQKFIRDIFMQKGAKRVEKSKKKSIISEFSAENAGRMILDKPANIHGLKSYKIQFYVNNKYINLPDRIIKKYRNSNKTNENYKKIVLDYIKNVNNTATAIKLLKGGKLTENPSAVLRRKFMRDKRVYLSSHRKALGLNANATDETVERKMNTLNINTLKQKYNKLIE